MVRIARDHRQVPTQLLYYKFAGLVPALGNAEIILSWCSRACSAPFLSCLWTDFSRVLGAHQELPSAASMSLFQGCFLQTLWFEKRNLLPTRGGFLMWIICSVLTDVHLATRHRLKPPSVLGAACSRGDPLHFMQILLPTVQQHEKLVIYVLQPQSRAQAAWSCLFLLPLSTQLFLQLPLLLARRRVCLLWLKAEVWKLCWENALCDQQCHEHEGKAEIWAPHFALILLH